MASAGQDSGAASVQTWAERLTSLVSEEHSARVAFLTALLDDANLGPDAYNEALQLRGNAFRHSGNLKRALAGFERALELAPRSVRAIAARGETYRLMNQYDQALTDYSRAIELDPEYVLAIANRAYLHWQTERHEAALADFTRAINLNPGYHWSITLPGDIYRRLGRSEKALSFAQQTERFDVSDAMYALCRGEVFWLIGWYDKALTEFDQLIQSEPNFTRAISNRGETYLLMGRYDEALTDLNRAIELEPNVSYQRFLRGVIVAAQGDSSYGRQQIRKAANLAQMELLNESAEALHQCHFVVYTAALGNWSEATQLLLSFLKHNQAPWFVAHALFDLRELSLLPGVDSERLNALTRLAEQQARDVMT